MKSHQKWEISFGWQQNSLFYVPFYQGAINEFFCFFTTEAIMVAFWGSGLTQMGGLWRCPERLSYALAVESGMCSGTETVFSTGRWWISVHLDNGVVRSLGCHSADQRLMRGSGSSGGLLTTASLICLVWNLESHRRTKEEVQSLLMVAMTQPWVLHQAVVRAQSEGIKRWATGPGLRQGIWSQFGVPSQPRDNCWGPSGGSLNQPPPPHAQMTDYKYFQFNLVVRWTKILPASGNSVQTQAGSRPRFLCGHIHQKMYKSSHKVGLYGLKLHKSSSLNVTSCLTALFHAWWNAKRSVSKALHIKCLLKCLSVILHRWHILAF